MHVCCAAYGGPSGPASGTGQYSATGTDVQPPAGPDQGGPIQGTTKGASGKTTVEAPPPSVSGVPPTSSNAFVRLASVIMSVAQPAFTCMLQLPPAVPAHVSCD